MIFVGDEGTFLDLILDGENISGAAGYTMLLRKPVSKTVVTVTAAAEEDDTLRYVTVEGDIDEPGTWQFQGHIEDLAGWSGHTTIAEFEVEPILS